MGEAEDFTRELLRRRADWEVPYRLPTGGIGAVPDPLTDIVTCDCIRRALQLSEESRREVHLQGVIEDGKYRVREPFIGQKTHVIRKVEPYQSLVFDLHTHTANPTPSQTDLIGWHYLTAGALQLAIRQQRTGISPLFLIGHPGRRDLFCYWFEQLPAPQTIGEEDTYAARFWGDIEHIVNAAKCIDDSTAARMHAAAYAAMLDGHGIRCCGRTLDAIPRHPS